MIRIGLTGSIGMGKSTTAEMFAAAGVPVYDADRAVHRLYEGGPAVDAIARLFPGVAVDGRIDRAKLAERVLEDAEALRALERIVHPLVRRDESAFLERAAEERHHIVVLDIPLLLETRGAGGVDAVVVVSAPAEVQRARVLSRPGMTEERFAAILAKQVPDAEKRRRAHFVVDTGRDLEPARRCVATIIRATAMMAG
jgi:dephospho-CoA kinase